MTTPVQPTQTNTHISSNFGKLLEPGLRKIFFETYAEYPEQFSQVFKVNNSSKAKETDYGLGAFSDWEKRWTNLDTVAYDTLSAGMERTYVHEAFTKGFMIERELYDDEQYRQINKFPAAMARSGRAHVEKSAATMLNLAFYESSPIYDGVPLIGTHNLVDSASTCTNLVTGALNDANLKIAMQCMGEQLDEAGNLIAMNATKLVVPPALEFVAKEIVNSTQKAGTDLNDVNTIKGSLQVVVLDYIGSAAGGSDTAWFLIDGNNHELNFFWRKKPEFKWDEDFDTFVAKYRGYMRFSFGASDWRGIVGSTGGLAASTKPVVTAPTKNTATVSVTTCVKDAALKLVVDKKVVATTVATGTTASFTGLNDKVLATGSKVAVIQTEKGKAPTCSEVVTVS